MTSNLKNLIQLFQMLDEVIEAAIFNQEHTYKELKKKQYIPYVSGMINESQFSYKSYSSFTIHYYTFSKECNVCIIGRFSDTFNESIHQLFSSLKKPNEIALQSTILDWIFDAIPEVIAFKDLDGYFRYVTKDGDALYKRFDTIVNKHYTEVYSEEAVKEIEFLDDEAYKQKGKVRRIIDIETDFGRRIYESTRTPLYDSLQNPLGIISINRDITESNQLKSQFELITSIQETLIDVANSFIDANNSQFSIVINEALKKIGNAISADRCYIFRYFFEENKMNNAFEWCNEGINPEIENLQNQPIDDYLENWVRHHRNHENVLIEDVSELDKSSALYQILSSQSIKSLLTMPIFTDDECYGFIGFDSVKRYRSWHDIPDLLKILPNLIGNLFSRFYLYKMLFDANEENKKLNHENLKNLSNVQSQIKRPIQEIRNMLSTQKNSEELQYQVDIIESTIENMTYVNEDAIIDKSTFNNFSLEELVLRGFNNNIKYAGQNNNRMYLNFDYNIRSIVTSNESKLTVIIDSIIKHLSDCINEASITLKTEILSDKDPYQQIKIGAITQSKITSSKIKKDLAPLNVLLKSLGSKIEARSTSDYREIYFVITFYIPKKFIQFKDVSTRVAFIDLTTGNSSNTHSQINSLYQNVEKFDSKSKMHLFNPDYDVVVTHTNNPDYYSSHIKSLMSNFNDNAVKILLYENEYSIVYDSSFTYHNHVHSLPIMTSELLSKELIYLQKANNQTNNDKPGVLIIDNNKRLSKMIENYYDKTDINIYQVTSSTEAKHTSYNNIKIIFIDAYLPLEEGKKALKKIRMISHYKDTHIYLMSTNLDSANAQSIINSTTHLVQKPLNKNVLKNLISHHLFDESFKSTDQSLELELFNHKQFKAFYPKIDNQEIMKQMILTRFIRLYNQLNENNDIDYVKIQARLEELSLQMHTDKLRHFIMTNKLTIENKNDLLILLDDTIKAIKKTISH